MLDIFIIIIVAEKDALFGTTGFTGSTRSAAKDTTESPTHSARHRRGRHVSHRQGHSATIAVAGGRPSEGPILPLGPGFSGWNGSRTWAQAGPVLSSSVAAVGESVGPLDSDGDADSDNYEAYPFYRL